MTFNQLIFVGLFFIGQIARSQDVQIIGDKYTYVAIDKKIEGKVYVAFMMAPNGKILDDSVKAMTELYGLEVIAKKAVMDAPDYKYTQGVKRSDKNEKFVIPIVFSLDQLNDKDWSDYYKIKGNKSWDAKDLEQAKKHLTESVRLNKRNSGSYYTLSLIFKEQGNEKKAIRNMELAKKYGHKD